MQPLLRWKSKKCYIFWVCVTILVLMKPEFSWKISDKYPNINFQENRCCGSRVIPSGRTDRQKDRHGEANLRFFWPCIMNWLYINYKLVITQAVYRQATRNSHREWQYHMLHVYKCILLKMSTWGSKLVEENNILWINNNTSQQDFGTRKVYFVSNVPFHAESKYAIKIFPSLTVFVQWPF